MLLTQQQQDKISNAVLEAEKKTSGEIVPMLIRQSDDYPGARWRLAIVFALLFGFITYLLINTNLIDSLDPGWILWSQIPGLYFGYWLGSFSVILRPFLHNTKVDEEIHQRALQAFFSRNLHSTKDRSAILIMVSLLERRVEIIADTGINDKVDENTWDKIIENMIASIKTQSLTDGFCTAIKDCGEVLQKDFPGNHNNTDELSNKLILID